MALLPIDEKTKDYIANVDGICEATLFEKHMLWEKNRVDVFKGPDKKPWEAGLRGYVITVGMFHRMPVVISTFIDKVDGRNILFWEATSVIVNYNTIREWFEVNFPKELARYNTNASNFHNLFR